MIIQTEQKTGRSVICIIMHMSIEVLRNMQSSSTIHLIPFSLCCGREMYSAVCLPHVNVIFGFLSIAHPHQYKRSQNILFMRIACYTYFLTVPSVGKLVKYWGMSGEHSWQSHSLVYTATLQGNGIPSPLSGAHQQATCILLQLSTSLDHHFSSLTR